MIIILYVVITVNLISLNLEFNLHKKFWIEQLIASKSYSIRIPAVF